MNKTMTAESLKKPFLSLSSYSRERNDCCRKLPILTVTLFVVICVSVSLSQIWNLNRINELQNEVIHLKNSVDEMRKHLGFDLFDDLRDFQEAYDGRSEDSTTDKYDTKADQKNHEEIEKGSGGNMYEDEEDDDENNPEDSADPDYLEDDSFAYDDDILGEDDTEEDNNNIQKNANDRLKRSISSQTSQGVPILDESYAENRSEDYINKILLKNNPDDPVLKLYWDNKLKQQYQRNSQDNRRHDKHDHRERIIIREHDAVHHTYGTQDPISRRSRVMSTNEDKSKAFRQVITKSEYDKLAPGPRHYAEQRQPPEQVVYKRRSMRKSMPSKGNLKRQRPVAIHFVREHVPHRRGNNVYNNQGGNRTYSDWVPAHWTKPLDMHNYFVMSNGVLTVRENGIYFVYAQIFYHDDHDTNGYVIEKNQEAYLQCTTMTHSVHRVSKSNTCYTGAVILLSSGDTIRLYDLGSERITLPDSSKSFFGLVKLSDAKVTLPPTAESPSY